MSSLIAIGEALRACAGADPPESETRCVPPFKGMPEITPLEINPPEKNTQTVTPPPEMNLPVDVHTPEKPPPSVLAK